MNRISLWRCDSQIRRLTLRDDFEGISAAAKALPPAITAVGTCLALRLVSAPARRRCGVVRRTCRGPISAAPPNANPIARGETRSPGSIYTHSGHILAT
jgi:hypothetical protein